MYPAADATDDIMLFSRIVNSLFLQPGNDPLKSGEERVREDARGDGDAEAPAGLETHVEIGERHDSAQHHPGQHRAKRELGNAIAAVDLFEPTRAASFSSAGFMAGILT